MKRGRENQIGFTIVELLIVIVVIAILAAISIIAYNGVQSRSRDAKRATDAVAIKKALEMYKVDNGQFPNPSVSPGCCGGWEASSDTAGTFISSLNGIGFTTTPIDPINTLTNTNVYMYYRYDSATLVNTYGCNAALGGLYVLRIQFENAANRPKGNAIGGNCSSPQVGWSDTGTGNWYVYHAFENQ